MSHDNNTKLYEELEVWLEQNSCSPKEILLDSKGYFFYSTEENGTASDDGYDVRRIKKYLPDEFQGLEL